MGKLSDVIAQNEWVRYRATIEGPINQEFFVYSYEAWPGDMWVWVINDWYEISISRETIIDKPYAWRDELMEKLRAIVWYSMPVHDEPRGSQSWD